jgi:lipopolysaccharide exporter
VSRFFGPPVLGVYNLAYNLADTPTTNVAEHIGDVLLPSFAKMAPGQRVQALLRSSAIMALLVFPLSVGLAAVAPTVVRTLFDRRWIEVAPMLMILSSLSVVRPMSWCLASFLQVQQRPRTIMVLGFLKLAALLALVCTLGRLGPRWTCVSVGLAFTVHSAAMLYVTQIAEGVPAMGFISGALPPLLACAPMFAAVVGVRKGLEAAGIGAGWLSLGLQIVAGALAYGGAALVVARATALDMLNLLKNAARTR